MQQLKELSVENHILIRKTLEYKQIVFSENYHQIVLEKFMKTWDIVIQKRLVTWKAKVLLAIYGKKYPVLCDNKIQMYYFKKAKLQ